MTGLHETGIVTGTRDKDYNLLSYVQSCLENALRMGVYLRDAERDGDGELVELFTRAQAESRKGAEIGKTLLSTRLAGGTTSATGMGTRTGAGTGLGAQPTAGGARDGGTDEEGALPPTDVMAPDQVTPERGYTTEND